MKVAGIRPGTEVELELVRDRKHKTVTAKLGELPVEDRAEDRSDQDSSHDDLFTKLGMELSNVTSTIRQEYELPDDVDGVVVTSVKALGAAGRANFRVGDVILEVDDVEVRNLDDLRAALADVDDGAPVLFLIQRAGYELHLALRMPK